MTKQTTCPICHTIFRVTELSLTGSKGMVQCGVCGMVFDAHQNAITEPEKPSEPPLPSADIIEPYSSLQDHSTDSSNLINLEVDNSFTESIQPVESVDLELVQPEEIPLVHQPSAAGIPSNITEEILISSDHIPDPIQFKAQLSRKHTVSWLTSAFILLLILIAQLVIFNRDHIAASNSWATPFLETVCSIANCKVSLPRDISSIKITHTSFEADPKNTSNIVVNIGLENDSDLVNAFPDIALSLTNDDDLIVTKKNFKPRAYLTGSNSIATGLRPHTELNVKLVIDVNDTSVSGYKLATFYSY